jgi:hypothetical protein
MWVVGPFLIVMMILGSYWWMNARAELPGIATFYGLFMAILFSVLAYSLVSGRSWQVQIEGTTLSFRRPHDNGWASCEIGDIAAIWSTSIRDNQSVYEFEFRDGRRTLVEQNVFGPHRKFASAFSAVNPTISFAERYVDLCHACAEYLGTNIDRCPHCDAPISHELPPIRPKGIFLPDAIDMRF